MTSAASRAAGQHKQPGAVLGQPAAFCQPLQLRAQPLDLGLVPAQPGRGRDAPGPQRPPRIGQDLQQVPVGGRQHRLGKARPPRRHRHHPDRRAAGQPRTDRCRTSRCRLRFPPRPARAHPAEDLRDRFPGDLQPGQPLLGPRQPLAQPRDLTTQLIHLMAGCRLTPLQLFNQRSHRASPRSYPKR
jgi:hypothetical protein